MMKLVVGLVSLYKVTTETISKYTLKAAYQSRLKYTYIAGIFVRIFMRTAEDATVVTDASIRSMGKRITDGVSTTDAINSRTMQKTVTETLTVTDNLDGTATAEDEQTAQLFKATTDATSVTDTETLLFEKPLTDTAGFTDVEVSSFAKITTDSSTVTDTEVSQIFKPLADSGNVGDAGLLIIPNYADPAYFSELYVADQRTF